MTTSSAGLMATGGSGSSCCSNVWNGVAPAASTGNEDLLDPRPGHGLSHRGEPFRHSEDEVRSGIGKLASASRQPCKAD